MFRKPLIQYDGKKTTVVLSQVDNGDYNLSYWQDGYEVLTEVFNDTRALAFDRLSDCKERGDGM